MPFNILKMFVRNRDGNIAIMFGLFLFPMILFAGAAIDFNMNANRRADIQQAADAAALAAASPFIKDNERKAMAEKMFIAEMSKYGFTVKDKPTVDLSVDGQVGVYAEFDAPNNFLSVMGLDTTMINVTSIAAHTQSPPEIALVVDASGSMNSALGAGGARMDVLKTAAKNLTTVIESNINGSKKAKFAIIPFNMNVNVGAANTSFVTGDADPLFTGTTWAGCVLERGAPHTNSDEYKPGSSGPDGKWSAYIWPPEPDSGGTCTSKSDGTNSAYASIVTNPAGTYTVQTAGPNYNCIRHPIVPLNSDADAVRTEIDGLTAESNMGTIIAPGVAWGMRVLTPEAPFKEGDKVKQGVRKFMVVLTDGEQTTEAEYGTKTGCDADQNTTTTYEFDPADLGLDGDKITNFGPEDEFSAYGYIKDSDPFGTNPATWADVADDLYNVSIDACTEAKKKENGEIEIFTIAVSADAGPGTKTYDLLKGCATDDNHFFYAADVTAFEDAFQQIAKDVVNVRLVK